MVIIKRIFAPSKGPKWAQQCEKSTTHNYTNKSHKANALWAKTAADGCKVKIFYFNFRSFSIFSNCQRLPCQNSACHGHSYYEKNRFKVKLFYKLLLWKNLFSLPPIAGQILGLLDRLARAVSIDIISWCTFVHFGGYNRWKILLHSATSDGWWPALSSTAEEDQIRGRGKG